MYPGSDQEDQGRTGKPVIHNPGVFALGLFCALEENDDLYCHIEPGHRQDRGDRKSADRGGALNENYYLQDSAEYTKNR